MYAIRSYYAEQAGSQNKACELLGISAAVMSSIKNEKYKGDVQGVFKKLGEYFGVKAEAEQNYTEIVITSYSIHYTKLYEKASVFPRQSLYEVYGRIKMARELNAITKVEFLTLNHACVYDGINNPKCFSHKTKIRRKYLTPSYNFV